jgi:hypothetical protein
MFWQSFAHRAAACANAFANVPSCGQDGGKASAHAASSLFCDDCYPSPYPWPGPLWVRSSFWRCIWRGIAYLVAASSFGFHLAQNKVSLRTIKTINRGSVTCGNRPLFLWRFARPPFRLVWTTILNVAALERLAALLWQMRLAQTRSPARLLVALAAQCATTLVFVGKQHLVKRFPRLKTTWAMGLGGFFMPSAQRYFGKTNHV